MNARDAAPALIALCVLLPMVSGCVTTPGKPPRPHTTQIRGATFDAWGQPTGRFSVGHGERGTDGFRHASPSAAALGERIWGASPAEASPWPTDVSMTPGATDRERGTVDASGSGDPQDPKRPADPANPEAAAAEGGGDPKMPAPAAGAAETFENEEGSSVSAIEAPVMQDPPPIETRDAARIRNRFGPTVMIGRDGRVTKQYFLTRELGPVFLKLIGDPVAPIKPEALPAGILVGGADDRSVLGRMLDGQQIEVTYLSEFESLGGVVIRDKDPKNPAVTGQEKKFEANAPKTALVLVTAAPLALAAFEDALNLFYANTPQVEITVQVIEYSTADALAFGVDLVGGAASFANLNSNQLVQNFTSGFPLRPPLVGGSPVTDVGTFQLGGIHDNWELNAFIQLLEVNNVADVTSSPKLVVRNGGMASVSAFTDFPFPQARIDTSGANVTANIEFRKVGVTLNILPMIAGTETVILQVSAEVSAVTGFIDTLPVSTPIVSNRNATTTVHLKRGHSLVIGGLSTESKFDSENKVPILGDIPILGALFRSTSTQSTRSVVSFQITPRILTNDRGVPATLLESGF